MTRSCVLLVTLAIVVAAAEDVSSVFSGAANSVTEAANTEQPEKVTTEQPDVNKSNLTNHQVSALGSDAVHNAPRFYNLTSSLKRGATVKDVAALISAEGGAKDVIVRRKRTFHKKGCSACGGGGGYGGGYGGHIKTIPIVIQIIKTGGGGGCGGGGCGGGSPPRQWHSPCGGGGCQPQQPVYHQPHPQNYCDRCGNGGGHPGGGGGSWSYSQSSSQSSSSSGTWKKK